MAGEDGSSRMDGEMWIGDRGEAGGRVGRETGVEQACMCVRVCVGGGGGGIILRCTLRWLICKQHPLSRNGDKIILRIRHMAAHVAG